MISDQKHKAKREVMVNVAHASRQKNFELAEGFMANMHKEGLVDVKVRRRKKNSEVSSLLVFWHLSIASLRVLQVSSCRAVSVDLDVQ